MSTNRPIVFLIGLGVSLTLLGVAGWQWHRANVQTGIAQEQTKEAEAQTKIAREQTRIAESRRLAVLSDAVRPERLDLAMLLAVEAAKEGDTLEARGSLQRSLDARPEVVRFLHDPEDYVSSVAFGPEGQLAAGYRYSVRDFSLGGVGLFDARGERLRPTRNFSISPGNRLSTGEQRPPLMSRRCLRRPLSRDPDAVIVGAVHRCSNAPPGVIENLPDRLGADRLSFRQAIGQCK